MTPEDIEQDLFRGKPFFGVDVAAGTYTIPPAGPLTREMFDWARERMLAPPGPIIVDPKILAAYNRIAFGKPRMVLATTNSPCAAPGFCGSFCTGKCQPDADPPPSPCGVSPACEHGYVCTTHRPPVVQVFDRRRSS